MAGASEPLPEERPIIEELERAGYEFEIDRWGWGFHHLKDSALQLVRQFKTIAFLDLFEAGDAGEVTDQGLSYLADNRSLVSLHLGPGVSDDGLAHLVGLTQLEELWVHTGEEDKLQLTDRGMLYVAKLNKLESFSLGHSSVGDAGVELLTDLTHLRDMGLGSSNITNAVIPTLLNFKQLTNLDVEYTALTENGIKKLKTALPNCKIRWPR